MNTETNSKQRHDGIRSFYAQIAEGNAGEGCGCGPECCGESRAVKLGYSEADLRNAPTGSNLNLGCGNPIAIASIKPGETVLDLGSGAGFDCFLAARQLAGTGRVIGVDMTPQMVERARENARRTGTENVEFRLGQIESIPVGDAEVDLVISNCVFNLSPDKPAVFREVFRVLKPGGRLAISDIVAREPLPDAWREDARLVAQCAGGAETADDLARWLFEAGFIDVSITANPLVEAAGEPREDATALGERLFSAMIQARKP